MKLENVTLRYDGVTVLENLSLELPDSGMICLFAPSGSGKTTILHLLCGLLKPDNGRLIGLEEKIFAVVFQENRLISTLSVRDNVGLVLDKSHQHLAKAYLEQLGLAGWEDALPDELSGGMQRRVAIARALAFGKQHEERAVYLLDEPLTGLDEQIAAHTIQLIRAQTAGKLGFFVTHDLQQAKAVSDYIVRLDGRPMRVQEIAENRG